MESKYNKRDFMAVVENCLDTIREHQFECELLIAKQFDPKLASMISEMKDISITIRKYCISRFEIDEILKGKSSR